MKKYSFKIRTSVHGLGVYKHTSMKCLKLGLQWKIQAQSDCQKDLGKILNIQQLEWLYK